MVTPSQSVASSLRMCEEMKHRFAQPAQLLEDLHEFDARARVQPAGGFVEQQQVGIVHQHPRQADPLLHPP